MPLCIISMKKYIYIVITLLITSFAALAQEKPIEKGCDFLGSLHFKNGKATIIVQATYKEFFRSGDELFFTKLEKKGKLRKGDYFVRCCGGSKVGFVPENCSKMYSATMRRKIKLDISHFKPDSTFYLLCTVYDGVEWENNSQFFTIENIFSKRP